MLLTSLTDASSYDVRFAGVQAASAFLLLHEKDSGVLKHMQDLLLPILSVTMESVEKGDDADEQKSESFTTVLTSTPIALGKDDSMGWWDGQSRVK